MPVLTIACALAARGLLPVPVPLPVATAAGFRTDAGADPPEQHPCPLTWLCRLGNRHTNGVRSISRPRFGDGDNNLWAFSSVLRTELLDMDDDGERNLLRPCDVFRAWRCSVLFSVWEAASHLLLLRVEGGDVYWIRSGFDSDCGNTL